MAEATAALLPARPAVLAATPLVRETALASTQSSDRTVEARDSLRSVIIDDLTTAPEQSLHLPEPNDERLRAVTHLVETGPNDRSGPSPLWRTVRFSALCCENGVVGTLDASTHIDIRPYVSADADATLTVFQNAITVTAAADYSPEQIAAWARRGSRDVSAWDGSMRGRDSYVAIVDGQLAGFADVGGDGHIDKMFVSPDFARRGVARALMAFLDSRARHHRVEQLSANVSITARPFFEDSGFRVNAEQHPIINGVSMTNFRMTKVLEPLR